MLLSHCRALSARRTHPCNNDSSRMTIAATLPRELCVALIILAHRRRVHVKILGEAARNYMHSSRSVIEISFE